MLRRLISAVPPAVLFLLVALLTLPVVAVALSWLQFDAQAQSILVQMLQTVLPDYTVTSCCCASAWHSASPWWAWRPPAR
jgi:iron(III) transport system permease protein